jgi:hypothetical protein
VAFGGGGADFFKDLVFVLFLGSGFGLALGLGAAFGLSRSSDLGFVAGFRRRLTRGSPRWIRTTSRSRRRRQEAQSKKSR